MSFINAIILGLVQGLTEFIPVSSSGHLVIIGHFLNIENAFTFDVLLNFGSLLALVVYYRKHLMEIVVHIFKDKEWTLALKIIGATIPAVMVGVIFNKYIEMINGMIWVVVITLITVGVLMILFGDPNKDADEREIEKSVDWKLSQKIGFAQMIALIPGVSRSGITMLMGIRNNLSAARAAEFSFLLAIPIIAGASLKTLVSSEGREFVIANIGPFLVGNLVSFASGLLAINFLIKLISKRGLRDFGWYRVVLGLILVCLLLLKVI